MTNGTPPPYDVGWDRVEAMARSEGLSDGLQAKIADPQWMLARQWQVGEFRGDDAAQPAAIQATWRTVPLTGYHGPGRPRPGDPPHDLPRDRPLESIVEASASPDSGAAGLHVDAAGTRRLAWLLRRHGLAAVFAALLAEFPVAQPERAVAAGGPGRAAVALLTRRALDTRAVAGAPSERLRQALAGATTTGQADQAVTIIGQWREWFDRRIAPPSGQAWDDARLEHSFTLEAGADTPIRLRAGEHDGGPLDWYTFDLPAGQAKPPTQPSGKRPGGREPAESRIAVLPTPARYRGMPASRWWELEEGEVNFGDLEAGPADLARLLVAEFATSYRDDWFVVPIRVRAGSLIEMRDVHVIDTFGGRTAVASVAATDHDRLGPARPWRLFELSGDEPAAGHPSPWLLVPPATVGDLEGPVLEEVRFARDEGANLVWGIESAVEGPLGRPVDRADAWHTAHPRVPAEPAQPAADPTWRYRLEAPAPPWWIPFIPERIDPAGSAQVRLRRARMQSWSLLDGGAGAPGQVGPQSTLLDPRRPRWLSEEQVPRDGVRVEVRWRYARWTDGSVHLWRQRHRRPGRGERSSGLRWDIIERD